MAEFKKQTYATAGNDRPKSFSNGRRAFLGIIAAFWAGLTGSILVPKKLLGLSSASPQSRTPPAAVGGRTKVVASDAATVAETSAGRVRGYERDGVYIFKGVPYGASTSGAGRFMPPAKPEPWAGIRNALAYGRVCPQQDSAYFNMDGKNLANADEDAFLLHRGSAVTVPGEDCPRVNIWTPEINGSRKRPVMVYMHGGGFSGGSGHDLLSYEGESLARNHDVVVVNHNHRLNVYGYLNLGAFGGEDFAMSSNVGMLDIIAVLEWVRTHIATFGGDPDNVTIFGQSGGGGKVIALMAYVERLIGSIRRECLDHVIVWNHRSLRRILSSYFAYYQRSRTHLALGKDMPERRTVEHPQYGPVFAIPQVGGLHHRYQRCAA